MADPLDELDGYGDEAYFDKTEGGARVFDSTLLREPVSVLPARKPICLAPTNTVTDAVRQMQGEHRGCVVITADGTPQSPVQGIFTERDVLFRIVDRGRNPATLALSEVMTPEPECVADSQPIAVVLNRMSVGGFRHIPVLDTNELPVFVVSVRDVVEFLVEAFPREVLTLRAEPGTSRQREGA